MSVLNEGDEVTNLSKLACPTDANSVGVKGDVWTVGADYGDKPET